MLEWTHPKCKMVTFQSSQGQCHNFTILMHDIYSHFWHFKKCNMVWDCFRTYWVTFGTYFTVNCTQLLVKSKHQIFNFFDDSFNQTVMEHVSKGVGHFSGMVFNNLCLSEHRNYTINNHSEILLTYDSCSWFSQVRENYSVRAILSEISRLTEHMWSEYYFSLKEGDQNSWIYGFDYVW